MRSISETRMILRYLRMARAMRLMAFMARMALLEDPGDHLIERRILNAHVDHGVVVENGVQGLRDAGSLHAQLGDRPLATGNLAEAFQADRGAISGKLKFDQLGSSELFGDAG